MRVVCDNCGMSYKIPDSKLTKEVNKATCRKCGHAIYIRRPDLAPLESAPAMLPDERTLITTNAAAGMRPPLGPSSFAPADNGAAEPLHNEATNPRAPASPPAAQRPAVPAALPPAVEVQVPDDLVHARQRTLPLTPEAPTEQPWQPEPEPITAARAAAPAPYREPSRPRPAVEAAPPPTTLPFDPRADITGVLLGALLAAFGVLVLVANTFVGNSWITGIGTFLALLGCFIAILLVLTGSRGTRPASWVAALLGGFILASGSAAVAVLAGSYTDLLPAAVPVAGVTPPVEALVATPPVATAPVPAPPTPEPVAPPVVEPAVPVVAPPTPPVAVAPAAPPVATPAAPPRTTTPAATTTRTETPARTTEPARPTTTTPVTSTKPATTATTPAAASASSTITPTIIDTIIKSNKNVKGCFITEKNNSGAIPSGVKVRFTIQPSGKVTSASVPSGKYTGTDFDSCLSGAMKSLVFPPFTGDPITMSYTFPV